MGQYKIRGLAGSLGILSSPKTRLAKAKLAIIKPFQSQSILLSVYGRGLCARKAKSLVIPIVSIP